MSIESETERYCSGDSLHDAVAKYVSERVLRDSAFPQLVKNNPRLHRMLVMEYLDLEYDNLKENYLAELRDDA
jgi:hypothetical protein